MKWPERFKSLDMHWATSDAGRSYHLVAKHSCQDHHALCGRPHLHDELFTRLSQEDRAPQPESACVYCVFRLARMLEPFVADRQERHKLHQHMIELQENIRLREMAWDHRN